MSALASLQLMRLEAAKTERDDFIEGDHTKLRGYSGVRS